MIKRITDINSTGGVSSPLLPLIYADLKFSCNDSDGAFVQIDEKNEVTAVFSSKNGSSVLVGISSLVDSEEIQSFFGLSGVTSVVSDFSLDNLKEKSYPLLNRATGINETGELYYITEKSGLCEYKSVYNLLCNNKENFENWFPAFSRKINNGMAVAVYKQVAGSVISTAVCTAIHKETAIISGVYTSESFRNKGYASECVIGLLSFLNKIGVKKAYLWCENKNISFYNKLGFTVCGQVYVREEL